MSKSQMRGAQSAYGNQPQGIIVLDRLPLLATTRLRAFVWCRNRVDHAAFESDGSSGSSRFTLMLGRPTPAGGNGGS